jgi:hypothetical protein
MCILTDIVFGERKMVDCDECGKTLGMFHGYSHPTMGKKYTLCSTCYNQVNESVMQWKEFVLSYNGFFNNKNVENNHHFDLIDNLKNVVHG